MLPSGRRSDTIKVMFALQTARTHSRLKYSIMPELTEGKIYFLYSAICEPLCDIYVIFISLIFRDTTNSMCFDILVIICEIHKQNII